MPTLIFLDLEGVLVQGSTGLFDRACIDAFNSVLAAVPSAKIVITSTHRVHRTPAQLETWLAYQGVKLEGKVHGCTRRDSLSDPMDRAERRSRQIEDYLAEHPAEKYVAIDDLHLVLPNIVITEWSTGFTLGNAEKAIAVLTE